MAANKYGSYPTSRKQLRQRKLAWALKITMGALANIQSSVPTGVYGKGFVTHDLRELIEELRNELRNIK